MLLYSMFIVNVAIGHIQ